MPASKYGRFLRTHSAIREGLLFPGLVEQLMQDAKAEAQASLCERGKVGAVLYDMRTKRVISRGHNQPISCDGLVHRLSCEDRACDLSRSCMQSVHAEVNCLQKRDYKLIPWRPILVVTTEPCLGCFLTILKHQVPIVIFGEPYLTMPHADRTARSYLLSAYHDEVEVLSHDKFLAVDHDQVTQMERAR